MTSRHIKSIWNGINTLLNKSISSKSTINNIVKDDVTYHLPSEISSLFNTYFCEVAKQISLSHPHLTSSSNRTFQNYLTSSFPNSFFLSDVSLNELISVVHNLKPSKTCIANCLSSSLLKDSIYYIAEPLLHIINSSFDKGIFPDTLKLSQVIPIFKKGNKSNLSNYRPISLTNPLGKVLEKLMQSRMMKYLEKYHILYDFQFGFRENNSYAVIDTVTMYDP